MVCDKIIGFGQSGYDLYKELHQNPYNQFIHGIGMPFTILGVFIWLPALLGFFKDSARIFNYCLTLVFCAYYVSWDPVGGLLCLLFYRFYIADCIRYTQMTKRNRRQSIAIGFVGMLFFIGLQEGIGHTFFEEKNSDLCQLPNSIIIAPIFGMRALFFMA